MFTQDYPQLRQPTGVHEFISKIYFLYVVLIAINLIYLEQHPAIEWCIAATPTTHTHTIYFRITTNFWLWCKYNRLIHWFIGSHGAKWLAGWHSYKVRIGSDVDANDGSTRWLQLLCGHYRLVIKFRFAATICDHDITIERHNERWSLSVLRIQCFIGKEFVRFFFFLWY